jgi:hypothetical protein
MGEPFGHLLLKEVVVPPVILRLVRWKRKTTCVVSNLDEENRTPIRFRQQVLAKLRRHEAGRDVAEVRWI